ncbi:MAG: mechanosensitive ion channel domain-containing protein [Gammaproteobacteria bacterium]
MKSHKKSDKWRFWLVCFFWLVTLSEVILAQELSDLLTGNGSSEKTDTPDKVITVEHTKNNDQKIEKRLQQIFSVLDELKGIKVSVINGVVTLQGEVGSIAVEEKAIKFAKQMENVVEVENKLVISYSLLKRSKNTFKKIAALGEDFITWLPLFFAGLLIVFLFWMLGKWGSTRKGFYRRISANFFIAELLGKLTHIAFVVVGIITALTLLDATALIGTFLGVAGIFGVAIGFAIRDSMEIYITSLLLSLRNPFEVNDFVSIEGQEGTVARLTSRATILISPDGNHIRIPNSTVFKAVIINYTRKPERRFEFDVGIDSSQDLLTAQGLALKVLESVPGVLEEPKAMALVQELGDSNVILRIYAWVDQRNCDFIRVRSEAIRHVKEAFDEANIAIPEPIYNIKISHETQEAPEKKPTTHRPPEGFLADEEIEHQKDKVKDTTAVRTVEREIEKENAQKNRQNLLDSDAPSEID